MWPFKRTPVQSPHAPENIMEQLRAPVVSCHRLPGHMVVHLGNIADFERVALRQCGHYRFPSDSCLVCRDVEFINAAIMSGPVNVYPSQ